MVHRLIGINIISFVIFYQHLNFEFSLHVTPISTFSLNLNMPLIILVQKNTKANIDLAGEEWALQDITEQKDPVEMTKGHMLPRV
uniref:Uncharacterized protein n=1 Tax=Arion vulgaris TaxID=1028688 RepID=A0A0B7BF00_9EUPU